MECPNLGEKVLRVSKPSREDQGHVTFEMPVRHPGDEVEQTDGAFTSMEESGLESSAYKCYLKLRD